ncbi:unnamed protein product [Lathyrus sativus]|nr:unnamed protein product [Lathyrus sativus]
MNSMNQDEVINDGEVPVNGKRSRGEPVIKSGRNIKNQKGKDGKYHDSHHEMHIRNERERRNEMRNMFASLHSLLPDLLSKVDKSTIVDAAVKEIKNLQQILENLEKKKQEKLKSMFPSVSDSSSVTNSPLNSYESRKHIIVDQGPSNNNNKFPISAIETSNALSLYAPPPQQVAFQTWSSKNVMLNICGGEAQFCICSSKKSGLLTIISFVLEKHMIDVVSINITRNGNVYMILIHASHGSYNKISMEETYKQTAGEISIWIS